MYAKQDIYGGSYLFLTFRVWKRYRQDTMLYVLQNKGLANTAAASLLHINFWYDSTSAFFFFPSSFSMASTLRLELLLFITHAKHSAWSSWARLYCSVKLACFLFTAHQTDLQFQRKPQTFSTIITCVKSPSMHWNEGEKRNRKAEAMQHKSRKLIFFAWYTKYAHISLVWRSVLLKCTWNRIPTIQTVIYLVCSTFKTLKLQAWYILHSLNPINHSRFQYSCNCCFLLFVLFSVFISNFEWIFSETSCAICWACLARQAG